MAKRYYRRFIMSEDIKMTDAEEQVYEQLKSIVISQLASDPSDVIGSASFTADLGADSLDVVELVMRFEEQFDIPIADEVAGEMTTVKDAVAYITKAVGMKTKEN